MDIRALDLFAVAGFMALGLLALERQPEVGPPVAAAPPSAPPASFPPAPHARPAAYLPVPAADEAAAAQAEIDALGRRPPRFATPARRQLAESTDLLRFVLSRLDAARSGDAESQYLLYLALEECRTFLRLNAESALQVNERMFGSVGLSDEERAGWDSDYQRCMGFAVNDWSAVAEALGRERPGSETEYGSVWFERAARGGHPPALAEQALRPGPLTAEQRRARLEAAVLSRDPEVFWLLFMHGAETGALEATAWLIAACRAGLDCTEHAAWFRGMVCGAAGGICPPGESALGFHWQELTAGERHATYVQAGAFEATIAAGAADTLPLPEVGQDAEFRPSEFAAAEIGDSEAEENPPAQ